MAHLLSIIIETTLGEFMSVTTYEICNKICDRQLVEMGNYVDSSQLWTTQMYRNKIAP